MDYKDSGISCRDVELKSGDKIIRVDRSGGSLDSIRVGEIYTFKEYDEHSLRSGYDNLVLIKENNCGLYDYRYNFAIPDRVEFKLDDSLFEVE